MITIKSYNLTLKKLFPILVVITLLVCISVVSAANNNQTINTNNNSTQTSISNVIKKTVQDDTSKNTTTINSKKSVANSTSNLSSNTKSIKSSSLLKVVYVSKSGNDKNSGLSNSPKATISNALSTLASGGTIYIGAGRYYQHNIYIDKSVKIIGYATKSTIIDGGGSHVFTIASGTTLSISKLRITNAMSSNGGAIYNKGTLRLSYVKIDSSKATKYGGAIYNKGSLTCTKSTFSNNYAKYGGAIYNDGLITMLRCSYNKNNAKQLGSAIASSKEINVYDNNFTYNSNSAVYIKQSSKTNIIKDSNFLSNNGVNGGAIYNMGNLLLNKTYFSLNKVTQYGGAIYNKGTLTSHGNTYVSNMASSGGAIYTTKTLYVNYNSFRKNGAKINGGAITNTALLTIKNTKYEANTATKYGGAIYNTLSIYKIITINNIVFTNNKAKLAGAIYTYGYAKLSITSSTFTQNTINALFIKTHDTTNTIYSSTFNKNSGTSGGAIYNYASTLNVNKVTFKSNTATKYGGVIYNYKGKTTIVNSIIENNNKIDLYNTHGKITANYNWWCLNTKPSSTRQYNTTVSNWIYLKVSTSSTCYINNTLTTTVSINNVYNGNKIITYKTSTYLPTITVNGSISGCGVSKTFKFTNGQVSISNKFSKAGTVLIKAYTYNQLVTNTIKVCEKISYITSLYVQMTSTITSTTVSRWVKAGITDVYVQAKASTGNTAQLRKVISLCSDTTIRVHAWVICFITTKGFDISTKQQTMIKNFIYKVVRISGVKGVVLDYVRYSGTSKNVDSSKITNFVKSVNYIVKGYNKNLILSASLFAEKGDTVKYYGQSYQALSPYLDYELLMAYKYNYNQGRSWIKSVIAYAAARSKHAMVVAVLQTYNKKYKTLSSSELTLDAKYAISGGSYGYSLFRYGLISSYPTSAKKLVS